MLINFTIFILHTFLSSTPPILFVENTREANRILCSSKSEEEMYTLCLLFIGLLTKKNKKSANITNTFYIMLGTPPSRLQTKQRSNLENVNIIKEMHKLPLQGWKLNQHSNREDVDAVLTSFIWLVKITYTNLRYQIRML